jgi:hypothetical protein
VSGSPNLDYLADPIGIVVPSDNAGSITPTTSMFSKIGGLGGAATLFGLGLSTTSAILSGQHKAAAYRLDAQSLGEQIKATTDEAQYEERQRKIKYDALQSSTYALGGASGAASYTFDNVRRVNQERYQDDISNLWAVTAAHNQQLALRQQADVESASSAETGSFLQVGASIAGALASSVGKQALSGVGDILESGLSSVGSAIASGASEVASFIADEASTAASTISDFFSAF